MRRPWSGIVWLLRKFIFLATLLTLALVILLLPAAVSTAGNRIRIDLARYWDLITFHLEHLVRGQLLPPGLTFRDPLFTVQRDLAAALPLTLRLDGTAFLISLLLGVAVGVLLTTLAPRWVRAPLWGATTMLYSLPDLLIGSFLNMVLLLIALARNGAGITWGSDAWQSFWAPVLALTLVVLPYIARVTALAIEETLGQLYVRAAVARGVHPARILVKHIGKNVLLRLITVLPVIVSLLYSSGAVVEYMSDVRGVGLMLIKNAGARVTERYASVVYLIPMLVLFAAALALSELVQRLLDPRLASARGGAEAAARPVRLALLTLAESVSGLAAVGRWLLSLPAALWAGLMRLPGGLRRAMRDPVLLAGTLLVLGLVVVAVGAPWLAPYDPAKEVLIVFGPNGEMTGPPFLPGREHWLGTDAMGRDTLSQILFGTRYALAFALVAVPVRFLMAVPLGLVAAFRGRVWDGLIDWLSTFFTAIPLVLLPLVLIPAVNLVYRGLAGPSFAWAVFLIALPGAPRLARAVRQQAAEVLAQPFVEGAYAVGAGTARTLFRYVLPQMLPQLATTLTLEVPAVLTLTTLLGFFRAYPGGAIYDTSGFRIVAPLVPEWGSIMESPLLLLLAGRWWLWAPFVALCVAVLAFNLLGEGLRRVWASQTGWKWQGS